MSYPDKLVAGINFDGHGLAQSINAMQMDMNIMGIFGENVIGFDKIVYQRKDVVVSSFAEYIGSNAVSYSVDNQVGRLYMTENPLDLALSEKGYFQILNKEGTIELTRDGRFKLTKNGELVTLDGQYVLSSTGNPIVLPFVPKELSQISIGLDGKIGIFDEEKRGLVNAGYIGIVSEDGSAVQTNCVRQGYIESSNVSLEREYIEMANYQKSFSANRQMFKIQNNNLSTAISTLGRI